MTSPMRPWTGLIAIAGILLGFSGAPTISASDSRAASVDRGDFAHDRNGERW
jgi:hypothetical protein